MNETRKILWDKHENTNVIYNVIIQERDESQKIVANKLISFKNSPTKNFCNCKDIKCRKNKI